MPRLALKLEYLGKHFAGCQYQPVQRTVQGELEKALSVYLREPARVVFSGRTDSGVHARAQIAHIDVNKPNLDLCRLVWGLNGIVSGDLSVSAAQYVPETFHARFSALKRTYVYRILNRPQRSAFYKDTHYFIPLPLNCLSMSQAANALLGHHDFKAFKTASSDTLTTICRLERAELLNFHEGELEFWITANHFVYNMVRIIVGTLIEIGLGKRPPEALIEVLANQDRDKAGPTAPPWGLCLEAVEYPEDYKLFA